MANLEEVVNQIRAEMLERGATSNTTVPDSAHYTLTKAEDYFQLKCTEARYAVEVRINGVINRALDGQYMLILWDRWRSKQ